MRVKPQRQWIQMEFTSRHKCIKASLSTRATLTIFSMKAKIKPMQPNIIIIFQLISLI